MEFSPTAFTGLWLIRPFAHQDPRGSFVKPFRADLLEEKGLSHQFRECFYSESYKGVVRGMHFQVPPHAHDKLVFAISGKVLDVVLDLRRESSSYGRYLTFELSEENRHQLYIPQGMAHGFCARTEKATLFYFTTSEHHAASDTGIRYDSFGFDWPIKKPVISPRDAAFGTLDEFDSPF